ncbi:MAG: hypothetical protein AB7U61_15205 [Methylocystis sp.]
MSALLVSLIMLAIGSICFMRASSRDWRSGIKDRKAFLLFCLIFGIGSLALALAAKNDAPLFWSRAVGATLLLVSAAVVFLRDR